MSAANPADHIKFLVSCIHHASNGKVDFEAVRLELDIVSKAAAAKRYERLLKSYASANASEATGETAAAAPKKRKAPAAAKGEAKKPKGGSKKAIKAEESSVKSEPDTTDVKEEVKDDESEGATADL